jgi:hypothetical protein
MENQSWVVFTEMHLFQAFNSRHNSWMKTSGIGAHNVDGAARQNHGTAYWPPRDTGTWYIRQLKLYAGISAIARPRQTVCLLPLNFLSKRLPKARSIWIQLRHEGRETEGPTVKEELVRKNQDPYMQDRRGHRILSTLSLKKSILSNRFANLEGHNTPKMAMSRRNENRKIAWIYTSFTVLNGSNRVRA